MQVFQRLTLDTIGQCALAMRVNCQRDKDDQFLAMVEFSAISANYLCWLQVRASLDRQIDTTVIVASCFPLVESIIAWIFKRRGRKKTNQVTATSYSHNNQSPAGYYREVPGGAAGASGGPARHPTGGRATALH